MTIYEALNFYREPYLRLLDMGVTATDIRLVDLYTDYLAMRRDGLKVTYIVAALAERYHVCERKVYALIKRYGSDCNCLIFGGGKT